LKIDYQIPFSSELRQQGTSFLIRQTEDNTDIILDFDSSESIPHFFRGLIGPAHDAAKSQQRTANWSK